MAAVPNKMFLVVAGLNTLLAFAHTSKGREQFKHLSLEKLPVTLRGAVKTGWYEGSVFFAIMGVLNYKWAQAGILDVYDKGIAGLYISLLLGAGSSYASSGDSPTAVILSIIGLLQGIAAYRA